MKSAFLITASLFALMLSAFGSPAPFIAQNGIISSNNIVIRSGTIIADASGLTNISASAITGTIPKSRLPGEMGSNAFVGTFTGNGAGVTNMDAKQIVQSLSPTYKFAVIPDSQALAAEATNNLAGLFSWINTNVDLLMHVGDMIDDPGSAVQWAVNSNAVKSLTIPYLLSVGNHDFDVTDDWTTHSNFNASFPIAQFASGTHFQTVGDSANHYYTNTVGGHKFGWLSLQCAPDATTISWASNVIYTLSDHTFFIATHAYLSYDGTHTYPGDQNARQNPDGTPTIAIWTNLVMRFGNVSAVFSGHVACQNTARARSRTLGGNYVEEIFANWQCLSKDYVRVYNMDLVRNRIKVSTYSPSGGIYLTDPENSFEFPIWSDADEKSIVLHSTAADSNNFPALIFRSESTNQDLISQWAIVSLSNALSFTFGAKDSPTRNITVMDVQTNRVTINRNSISDGGPFLLVHGIKCSPPTTANRAGIFGLDNDGGTAGMQFGLKSGGPGWVQVAQTNDQSIMYGLLLNPNGGGVTINSLDAPTYPLTVNGGILASNASGSFSTTNGGIVATASTRTFQHNSTTTSITNTATATATTWGDGYVKDWYNGTSTSSLEKTNGNLVLSGSITPSNNVVWQGKTSFVTNFTVVSNIQIYCVNGTNQLITLPLAAANPWAIYRFSSTNGWGNFTLTNANGTQTIRDGTSLSLKQIGIGEIGLFSDGSAWWLASKAKTVFPNASWSTSTNIASAKDEVKLVTLQTSEFNNSQGLALANGTDLYCTNAGQYMLTFSAVVKGTDNASAVSIWLRQSGVDVPRSRTRQIFTSSTVQQCMTVNYFLNVSTNNTYFQLVMASNDNNGGLIASEAANPTGYTAPVMPGIIVTLNKISDSFP